MLKTAMGILMHNYWHLNPTTMPLTFISNKCQYYKIQGVLLPNTGKYGAVSRLIWGET